MKLKISLHLQGMKISFSYYFFPFGIFKRSNYFKKNWNYN